MVVALIFLSILIGLIEFFITRQRSNYNISRSRINDLNDQLEILKSLSFLYASKHTSLKDMLNDLAASFLMQQKLTTFILITSGDKTADLDLNLFSIFRFSRRVFTFFLPGEPGNVKSQEKMVNYLQKISDSLSSQVNLTPLEKYFLTNIDLSAKEQNKQVLVVSNLQNTAKNFGVNLNPKEAEYQTAVVMKLEIQKEEIGYLFFYSAGQTSESDIDFLVTIGSIIALNIKKFKFDQTLDFNIQRKVVNISW